jgi:hypothetical protein
MPKHIPLDAPPNDEDVPLDPDDTYAYPRASRLRHWVPPVAVAFTVFMASACLIISSFYHYNLSRTSLSSEPPAHCGTSNTTAEAKALGCVFEPLYTNWTPRQCHVESAAAEYRKWLHEPGRKMGSFPYFYDSEGTRRVGGEEEFSEAVHKIVLWTTEEEHWVHCLYSIRYYYAVAASKGRLRMNGLYGSQDHVDHCFNKLYDRLMAGNREEPEILNTPFNVQFDRCV